MMSRLMATWSCFCCARSFAWLPRVLFHGVGVVRALVVVVAAAIDPRAELLGRVAGKGNREVMGG